MSRIIGKVIVSCQEVLMSLVSSSASAFNSEPVELHVLGRLSLGGGKTLTLVQVEENKLLIAAGTDSISAVLPLASFCPSHRCECAGAHLEVKP